MPPKYSEHPDGGWNVKIKYQNDWSSPDMHQNGWSSNTGYYSHASGGKYPGLKVPMMAFVRTVSNNMMMNAEYETYQAGAERMRTQNNGVRCECYADFANGMHNGRHKVEWKKL